MLGPIIAAAALSFGGAPVDSYATSYNPRLDPRPIASVPEPAVNGRLWISRPIIGPGPGPEVLQFRAPGPEYYGAIDAVEARVPVRVGHLVVAISPWERIDKPGLRRFEEARQFWLHENSYTGGVRTFVNDLHLWDPLAHVAGEHEVQSITRDAGGVPEPRATIQLPADQPRERRPLRVHGNSNAGGAIAARGEAGRISWPMAAPAHIVHRSRGGVYTVAGAR